MLKLSIVALALFNKLLEPSCLDNIFFTPASSKTVRIELPAITPEPGADGRSITFAAPKRPFDGCGIEFELVKGTEIICF